MVRQRFDENMVYLHYNILNITITYSINIMLCTHLPLRVHIYNIHLNVMSEN